MWQALHHCWLFFLLHLGLEPRTPLSGDHKGWESNSTNCMGCQIINQFALLNSVKHFVKKFTEHWSCPMLRLWEAIIHPEQVHIEYSTTRKQIYSRQLYPHLKCQTEVKLHLFLILPVCPMFNPMFALTCYFVIKLVTMSIEELSSATTSIV